MNRFATRYWLQDWPLSVQLWACLSLAEGLTLAAILLYVLLPLRPEEPGQWYGLAALFPLLLIANLFAAKLAARRITEPLERLAGNLERIKGKNWSEPVLQTARRDEIGTIVNTLSQIQRNVVELNEDEEFFYQSVSHGLKTPIMVIQNCCAAYQDGIYGSEAIDIIMKESLAVEAGIRKLLYVSSYVLGGQGMEIAYNDRNITEFMRIINQVEQEHPILVDKYLMGREVEVDGVFDGEELLIPGIMEHIERAGVHSGDSISVYPPIHIEDRHKQTILKYTYDLSRALGVVGLVNIQFVIYDDQVYVIEVNPRSSRTIPYISKVTGVPIIDLATRVMLGQKLCDLGYGTGIYREADYYAVKMPVFSFEKLTDVDTGLGPEMKSTGECLGLAESFPQALLKAFKGAGMKAPKKGGRIIVTVKDEDKDEMIGIARGFYDMGIELLATSGTCKALNEAYPPAGWPACPRPTPTSWT